MKKAGLALLLSLLLWGAAYAQQGFPAMQVVDMVADSVVSIDVNRVVYGATTASMMGELAAHTRLATSYLSGFVYTENGYIITDSENIEDATILTVWLGDGTELLAEVAGIDEEYGIGVLKVESDEPLKPVRLVEGRYDPFNDVYPYDQGDAVVAIGYSGGLGGTVTFGIISAIRNMRNRNYILIPHVIQSDVAINSGNEGCPLLNERGEVVGMHDQRGSGMQNTTFFTPIWLIKRVADELIAHFEDTGGITDPDVWHPWLGIKPFAGSISPLTGSFREMGDDLKMYMDIPDQYWDVGVLIDTVWQESPAREFGLLDHDMLLDVTVLHVVQERENEPGKPYEGYDVDDLIEKLPYRLLKGIEELEIMVTTAERGDMLVFGVLRNFSYFQVEVEIGNHPGAFAFLSMMGAYGPGAQIYGVERSEEYF